ncbi:hypothetical protein AFCDBAGC_5042 [Methylobacterium cerastii]|uniref:Uncharacterized protein n=1 Tax=Methylobacterium cerastii TaxID=932741 RepID=A0ABQ4QQ18_9HYPH|nr:MULTISPECIES: hypothetical protein [Methylobacterium]GJD47156.1 hypothetical protein AFCDBAGC_5042 [Methylobacterium cerastii]
MPKPAQFEVMLDACLAAYELIKESGTPEAEALMRLVLFQIGLELARGPATGRTTHNDN